jgi:hypothetical protein
MTKRKSEKRGVKNQENSGDSIIRLKKKLFVLNNRYKKLKSLTPSEFTQLFERHLLLNESFEKSLDNFETLNTNTLQKETFDSKRLKEPSQPLDSECYPTREALEYIVNYQDSIKNPYKLLDFIKSIWMFADWGWKEEETLDIVGTPKLRIYMSTGGWSGNESIIEALKTNKKHFWQIFWEESRRGGHFKLLLRPRLTHIKEEDLI